MISDLEQTFEYILRVLGTDIPQPEREYRFAPPRRWRMDYAWPAQHVAVEIDGGQFAALGGRHNSDGDRQKLNAAALANWRVLHYSGAMLRNDPALVIEQIRTALG